MPAIDVAVGLMFLFFLLSIICSQVNELVATLFNFRAGELKRGIKNLVGSDVAAKVLDDPFVKSVKKKTVRDPTYIRARTFALAVLNQLPDAADGVPPDVEASLRKLEDTNPSKAPLLRLYKEADAAYTAAGEKLEQFKASIEDWYDDAMGHVSGWYRRRVQRWLLVYALFLTIGLNVDAGLIARTLWDDDALRQRVAAAAAAAQEPEPGSDLDAGERLDAIGKELERAKQLDLPLGWTSVETDPRAWPGWDEEWRVLWRLLGWAITVAALSLGAPFWFDLLGKVARVRQTGTRGADEREAAATR